MIRITINTKQKNGIINKNIYGHFSEHLGRCIYEGIWVGEDSPIPNTNGLRNDVIEALREMHIPLLRWPGGCFADEYHWMDGIGPQDERTPMINSNWGCVTDTNQFGTHEFLNLCELIGAEPYINGNVGSGTVREMQQWIEYITFDGKSPMADLRRKNGREKPWKLKYFGVGNESWGCGGEMLPDYYVNEFRKFGSYVKNYSGNTIYKIACGPNSNDYNWTDVLMQKAAKYMHGLSLHYYTIPRDWSKKGSAVNFDESEWFSALSNTLYMDELIKKHKAIMDKYDSDKRIGLIVDEWGTWYDAEPGTNPGFLNQQNSLRDALIAGINLNIFNSHCDRVQMANLAQLVNVLQSVILTEGEKMLLTPTYHVMKMYRVHQNAELLSTEIENADYSFGEEKIPQLSVSSSVDAEGKIHISFCNLDPNNEAEINCQLAWSKVTKVEGTIITADQINTCNTFDAPEVVVTAPFTAARIEGDHILATLPAKSVVMLEVI